VFTRASHLSNILSQVNPVKNFSPYSRTLHASPNINNVIKLRSIKWMMHVARMGEMRNA